MDSSDSPNPDITEASPLPLPTPEETAAAKELCGLLSKTAKATRIYARNNDIYVRFWRDLNAAMSRYLEEKKRISLQVGTDCIVMGDEVVYELKEREGNFAFRLYKDGIRRLDFLQGLASGELEAFLDIITLDYDKGINAERDIVSLIWEADFRYIQILSVDSFAEETAAEEGSGEEGEEQDEAAGLAQEVEQLAEALQQSAEVRLMKLDAEERKEYRQLTAGSSEFEERSALENGSIFDIDLEYREQLKAEIAQEGEEEISTARVGEVIFELFRQEIPGDFEELTRVVLGVIDVLLADGDLQTINDLLFSLRLLAMEDYSRAFLHHEHVRTFFQRLGMVERLEYLAVSLNEGRLTGGSGALFGFLSLQVPENVPGILSWLEKLSDNEIRRAGVDALIGVSGDDLRPFREAARSGRPELVADVIHGFGRVGDVSSLEVIMGAYAHTDPKVREEVLVALRSFDSPRAREIILTALNDPVEEVRLAALRYVAVHRDRLAGQLLIEQINAKAFRNRSFSEKRAMFMALAHIQGRTALPLLTNQFKQKRQGEVQRAAAHGIGVVGGSDARRLLEAAVRSGDAELAGECRKVLSQMH